MSGQPQKRKPKAFLQRGEASAVGAETPEDAASGVILADLARNDGQEHLRVSVVDYGGARFVSVRTWSRAKGGAHRPTPRGVHLRPSELRAVRDALDAAIQLDDGVA